MSAVPTRDDRCTRRGAKGQSSRGEIAFGSRGGEPIIRARLPLLQRSRAVNTNGICLFGTEACLVSRPRRRYPLVSSHPRLFPIPSQPAFTVNTRSLDSSFLAVICAGDQHRPRSPLLKTREPPTSGRKKPPAPQRNARVLRSALKRVYQTDGLVLAP